MKGADYISRGLPVAEDTCDLALDTLNHPKHCQINVKDILSDDDHNKWVHDVLTSNDLEGLYILMDVDDWEFLSGVVQAAIKNVNIKAIFLKKCVIRHYKLVEDLIATKSRVSLDHCRFPYTEAKSFSKCAKKICEAVQKSRTLKAVRIIDTLGPNTQIQLLHALRSCPMIYRLTISVKTKEMADAVASFLAPTPGATRSNFLILTLYRSMFRRDIWSTLVQALTVCEMEIILVFKKCNWPGKEETEQADFFRAVRRNLRVNIIIGPGNNVSKDQRMQLMNERNEDREVQIYRLSLEYLLEHTNKDTEIDKDKTNDFIALGFYADASPHHLESFFEHQVTEAHTNAANTPHSAGKRAYRAMNWTELVRSRQRPHSSERCVYHFTIGPKLPDRSGVDKEYC